MTEGTEQAQSKKSRVRSRGRRPGRMMIIFKAAVLLILMGGTAYGMMSSGLFGIDRLMPVVAGTLALLLLTLFIPGYYRDVSGYGWALVALLAALVAIKGVSLSWSISQTETVQEMLRSSMYLAAFVLALASLSTVRQAAPLVDAAILVVAAVGGYGLLQKIYPVEYPVSSLDGVRVDSTLDYANTAAVVMAMGALLVLARMTSLKNALLRGLYAMLLLAFLVTLYLTVSRGGIASFGIGLIVMFALAKGKLQMLTNLLLLAPPMAWLLWRMQSLDGLLQAGVAQQQQVEAGLDFRTDLLIAAGVAFVLQCGYALSSSRYELPRRARRIAGACALAGVFLVFLAGAGFLVSQYGGVTQTYSALANNPDNTQNTLQRLSSLSIGFREDYWIVAWNEWKDHPLTGTGAGTFQYTWLQERESFTGVKQVHNLYLEQGTETGVFAFLALVGFAALLIFYTAKNAWVATAGTRRLLLAGLCAASITYLVSSAFEWHWYIPSSTLLFFILAAAAAKLASLTDWDSGYESREPAPAARENRESSDEDSR